MIPLSKEYFSINDDIDEYVAKFVVWSPIDPLIFASINKQLQHFPIWICVSCQEQVNQSYEFKQKCYQTYKLLKKYSMQLYAANKEQSIPDLPREIYQDVKPIIDNNVISIDDDEQLQPYYNADDITIVKHELLPSNMKTEPEFNTMLQSIIDSNFETIRQIDGENYSLQLKREQNAARSTNERVSSNETILQQEQIVQNLEETCIPRKTVNPPTPDTITNVPNADTLNENNNIINPLNTDFTFDYTNDCFEQFASHASANVIVTTDAVTELCVNNQLSGNGLNTSTRVLRRRKSICYKTMEKSSLENIYSSNTKVIEEVKKRPVSPTKKQLDKETGLLNDKLKTNEPKKTKLIKPPKNNTNKTNNEVILRESIVPTKKLKEHKKKYGAYFCEKCSKQYVIYPRFRLHVSQCEGITIPQCNICHKVFASIFNLKRHDKIHLRAKSRFNCDLCRKHFAQQSHLRHHRRDQHSLNDTPFTDFGKQSEKRL